MIRFLLLVMLLAPFNLFAQSGFKYGYTLNNSGDTLKGYISYKRNKLNPEAIGFKTTLDAGANKVSVADCAGFGILEGNKYERASVAISLMPVAMYRLKEMGDTSKRELVNRMKKASIRNRVFLKVLQKGDKISLFSYTDSIKTRFYIQTKEDNEPIELVMNVMMDRGTVVTERTYLRQLLIQMQKHIPDLSLKDANINLVRYTEADLIPVVSKINDPTYVKPKLKSSGTFAGVGVNQSKVRYTGTHPLANSTAVSKTSNLPMITVGLDVLPSPERGKLVYRFDLSLLMSEYEVSGGSSLQSSTSFIHSFDQTSFSFTPQLLYNLISNSRVKFYLGAGAGGALSFYGKNTSTLRYESGDFPDEVTENQVDLNMLSWHLKLNGGLVINKRIELCIGYYPKSSIAEYSGFVVSAQRLTAGINYRISKL